jgi:tetratricopeptide (TPR) repeat protein
VRVLDFGLARAVDAVEPSASTAPSLLAQTVTGVGTWLGTPAYASPEHIDGQGIGPWSDQFSFCIALYEGLYGTRPFAGADAAQTLAAIAQCRPSPPPTDARVPAWLQRVVLRGLSRDPAQRYASMDDLLEAMTSDRRSRRRQRISAVAALLLTAALGAAGAYALSPEPSAQEEQLVERLTHEARAAAAESYFVYPPADTPEAPTAYRKVLELEGQVGAAEALADARAEELRQEFAATLVRLGDAYWEREGGAPFASDYYAAALVFDPDLEHARARTTLSPGEVRVLGDKAADGDFSPSELVVGESLAVLAEADPQRKASRARALLARDRGPSVSTSARLAQLVAPSAPDEPPPRSHTRQPGPPPADSDAPSARDADVPAEDSSTPAPPLAKGGRESAVRGDADALVREARREAERGNVDVAEELLHRALAIKKNDQRALSALAHLAFERARYHRAIELAERTVAIAPRRARDWLLLGDAHFRVMAYDDARRAYQRAADLGQDTARKRLAMLAARVGGNGE